MAKGSGETANTPAMAILDLDHLQLFTEGNQVLEERMAKLFLESARVTVAALQTLCGGPEIGQAWKSTAHKLAGSSAQIGALRLCSTSQMAEAAYLENAATKRKILAEIEFHLNECEEFFTVRRTIFKRQVRG